MEDKETKDTWDITFRCSGKRSNCHDYSVCVQCNNYTVCFFPTRRTEAVSVDTDFLSFRVRMVLLYSGDVGWMKYFILQIVQLKRRKIFFSPTVQETKFYHLLHCKLNQNVPIQNLLTMCPNSLHLFNLWLSISSLPFQLHTY